VVWRTRQKKIEEEQKAQKAADFKLKYPGKPYQDMENTRFAEILQRGCIAVIKSSYFEECLSKNNPFDDRVNIPPEHFICGENLMGAWKKHGAQFLVIFSYAWLTAEHPDPDMFHLRRIVRILRELRACWKQEGNLGEQDIGVILDYCSLWQKGSGEVDKRSEPQLGEFGDGLTEINAPYAHEETTAIKLMAVPVIVPRKYDDRGWTLFESIIIDGKASSPTLSQGKPPLKGSYNFLVFDEKFDPDNETKQDTVFVHKFAIGHRAPPCTPQRFDQQMQKRKERAKSKNVHLFTSGKDQDFVTDKYAKAFKEQVSAKSFNFTGMNWGDEEMESLAEVLAQCTCLEDLKLSGNPIGDIGTEKLAMAFPSLTSLRKLYLNSMKFGDIATEKLAAALPSLTSLRELELRGNSIGDIGIDKLAAALPKLTSLRFVSLTGNPMSNGAGSKLKAVAKIAKFHIGIDDSPSSCCIVS